MARDFVRELLDSALEDVSRSRMLFAEDPKADIENAILKMDTAMELNRVYGELKALREKHYSPEEVLRHYVNTRVAREQR